MPSTLKRLKQKHRNKDHPTLDRTVNPDPKLPENPVDLKPFAPDLTALNPKSLSSADLMPEAMPAWCECMSRSRPPCLLVRE